MTVFKNLYFNFCRGGLMEMVPVKRSLVYNIDSFLSWTQIKPPFLAIATDFPKAGHGPRPTG